MIKLYSNGKILGENGELSEGSILVENEIITGVLKPDGVPEKNPEITIDLEGKLVFPGLINAHDHLYYTFWPRFGCQNCRNWYDWETHYKGSDIYKKKQALSIADLYALGMYRNLFSGVTVVADHFPQEISGNFMGNPMISLVEKFGLAHSVSSHSLDWGTGIKEEFKATKGHIPFILHAEEGFDSEITGEIETLNRLGALAENTVLAGGLGFSDGDVDLIASRKASYVWCHSSQDFVFQKSAPIGKILDAGIKVAIGTDAVLTGGMNLFSEFRAAKAFSDQHLGERLKARDFVTMATSNAAEILKIDKQYGSISPGKFANLLVFEDLKKDPFESFLALTTGTISLLVNRGLMVYGDEKFRNYCSADFSQFSDILVEGVAKLVLGKPLQLLERIEYKLDEPKKFPFIPIAEA